MKKIFLAVVLIGLLLVLGYGVYSTITQSKGTSAKAGLGDTIDRVEDISARLQGVSKQFDKDSSFAFMGTNGQYSFFKVTKTGSRDSLLLAILQTEDFVKFVDIKSKLGAVSESEVDFAYFGKKTGMFFAVNKEGNKGFFKYNGKTFTRIGDGNYVHAALAGYVTDGNHAYQARVVVNNRTWPKSSNVFVYRVDANGQSDEFAKINGWSAKCMNDVVTQAATDGIYFSGVCGEKSANGVFKKEGEIFFKLSLSGEIKRIYADMPKMGEYQFSRIVAAGGNLVFAKFSDDCGGSRYAVSPIGDKLKFAKIDFFDEVTSGKNCKTSAASYESVFGYGGPSSLIFSRQLPLRYAADSKSFPFKFGNVKSATEVEDLTDYLATHITNAARLASSEMVFVSGVNAWYFRFSGGPKTKHFLIYSGI